MTDRDTPIELGVRRMGNGWAVHVRDRESRDEVTFGPERSKQIAEDKCRHLAAIWNGTGPVVSPQPERLPGLNGQLGEDA